MKKIKAGDEKIPVETRVFTESPQRGHSDNVSSSCNFYACKRITIGDSLDRHKNPSPEIIVIFVPIFLPLLTHFQIDPILWGVLVFVNLQAAFLSPPVAMSAFYLKGVSPPHVTINQIFAGMMPYMFIVIICMVLMYLWPGLTLWLPEYLYGPK